jgi:hypothetical protein
MELTKSEMKTAQFIFVVVFVAAFFFSMFIMACVEKSKIPSQPADDIQRGLEFEATPITLAEESFYLRKAIELREHIILEDDAVLKKANVTITNQRTLIQKQHDLIVKLYARDGEVAP